MAKHSLKRFVNFFHGECTTVTNTRVVFKLFCFRGGRREKIFIISGIFYITDENLVQWFILFFLFVNNYGVFRYVILIPKIGFTVFQNFLKSVILLSRQYFPSSP